MKPMSATVSVVFLTGAPDAASLQWNAHDLTTTFLPYFCTEGISAAATGRSSSPDELRVHWRCLPLARRHSHTSSSKRDEPKTTFLDTKDYFASTNGLHKAPGATLSQFFEQSFLLRHELPTSQVTGLESNEASFFTDLSKTTASSSNTSTAPECSALPTALPPGGRLTDLNDIPNAVYLRSITPQTVTVNMVVGIISVSQLRTIRSRREGQLLELLEITVGDDSKAGFGINFWLDRKDSMLCRQTRKLRPRDIILARNVALASYRGNVYGQSLRKDMTKLDLLYREIVDEADEPGIYTTAKAMADGVLGRKTAAVRDWVMSFVGSGIGQSRKRGRQDEEAKDGKRMRRLPPDTQ